MKPRTKFQQNVVAASKHLPPLTPAQIEWGYKNCIEHIGRRTPKGLITCTECGHTWQSENGELTDNLLGCECPHCHTTLKVETTLRRKFNDYEYLCIVTRCKGFQVLRFVYIECWAKVGQTPVYTHIEAVQRWIAPDGRSATFARLRPMGFFVHGWSWSSALELRAENDGKYNITPTRIYPRQRLIPELRRSGYGKQLPDVTPFDLIHLLLSENKAETLLKAGQTALVRFFARSSRNIADYWPAIRIAIRNGYAIGKPTEWCDYIDLLRFFGKDLHNAHFVCPADLPAAHDLYMAKKRRHMQMERRQEERRKALEQEASFVKAKGRFFGVEFSDGEIRIKVLDSVEAIRQEGEAMHHCVFTNEYYLKADSLILSATIDGKRIETIEVSLKRMEVVQSRGVCNKNTPYHGQILKLMKGNNKKKKKKKKKGGGPPAPPPQKQNRMNQIAYKFVSWDVPALESLAGSKAYILRKRLNDGGTLTREEKDWITREVNHNTYFKDSIPLLGYRFNFVDVLKTFVVKQYGHYTEYKGVDKTSIRSMLYGRVERIVEL